MSRSATGLVMGSFDDPFDKVLGLCLGVLLAVLSPQHVWGLTVDPVRVWVLGEVLRILGVAPLHGMA